MIPGHLHMAGGNGESVLTTLNHNSYGLSCGLLCPHERLLYLVLTAILICVVLSISGCEYIQKLIKIVRTIHTAMMKST